MNKIVVLLLMIYLLISRHISERKVTVIDLTVRQSNILEIVKQSGPITGKDIADKLGLSRAALRSDLAVLTMSGLLGARPRVGYYYTHKTPSDYIATILGNIQISDAHSLPVVIRENCSVYNAIVTMFTEDVSTIMIVSEGGFLEGVVSRKDLLKASMGDRNLTELPVKVAMTRMPNIIVTTPDEPVLDAAKKLLNHQVDALPVVKVVVVDKTEKLQVVGRFTKTNITRLFVQLADTGYSI
ncbi:CBS domain-containing protein [Propionispora vibrioides]|uniref:CBS domain-containing protein n=1 Tax=Propionispora vibrioides TaxID=112903 RepID=A0A1H8Q2S0_9FIRM|nr:CBS domain-containing protein [Propionispora vibrioides]